MYTDTGILINTYSVAPISKMSKGGRKTLLIFLNVIKTLNILFNREEKKILAELSTKRGYPGFVPMF